MESLLKSQISNKVKGMEQGAFQDFCLDYLPLLSTSYEGLERHGGTSNGKTRKGTPDLIKTFQSGKQLGVECSTEKSYWKPKKSKWKPCSDIDKCLNNLSDPQEIILCSSQEVPTDAPNAKTLILSYAKNKTDAIITLIACTDIENILIHNIDNPSYDFLFKAHLPEIYQLLKTLKVAQANKLTVDLIKEKPVSFEDIHKIVSEAFSQFTDINRAKSYAINKIDELKSRFELKHPPERGSVVRNIPENFPLLNPIGEIQTLLGVPKIGKTFLTAQVAIEWKLKNINVHWFESPLEGLDDKIFMGDISRCIWSYFLQADKASDLSRDVISYHSISLNQLKYKPDNPTVVIIDNAEFLSDATLRLIHKLLSILKPSHFEKIGVVFLSNKNLKHKCPVISKQFSAPDWSQEELKELLTYHLTDADFYIEENYLDLLTMRSGGHPLVALALARKCPNIENLIISAITTPSLSDEDLASEVKTLLFEDMLSDNDLLNFILRMSQLTFKAKPKIINAISNKITPIIAKPYKIMLDKLQGSVIDGDEAQGYSVSFIYKKVAENQLSLEEKKEVFNVVSNQLLQPQGNVIDATEVAEGIYYAVLGNRLEAAFFWTSMLTRPAADQTLSKSEMLHVLDRIDFITFINSPEDPKLLLFYHTMLFSMSFAYFYVGQKKKALDNLNKIDFSYRKTNDIEFDRNADFFYETVKFFKVLLIAEKDIKQAVKILVEVDFAKLQDVFFSDEFSIIRLFKDLTRAISIIDIPKDLLKRIVSTTELNDEKCLSDLVNISLTLATNAYLQGVKIEEVTDLLPSDGPIFETLNNIINAQNALLNSKPEKANEFMEEAINLCHQHNFYFKSVESIIQQVKGDIYYNLSIFDKAESSYKQSLKRLGDSTESFDYAWANYRLGLLSEDPAKANEFFVKSSSAFSKLGYEDMLSKSEGERGVALVQLGRPIEFVLITEWMAQSYYSEGKKSFAPACSIAMAQITRLNCDLEKKPLPEGKSYPAFERGVYQNVLDISKLEASGLVSFYLLSDAYHLLGDYERELKCLQIAFDFEITSPIDKSGKIMLVNKLLSQFIKNDYKQIKEIIYGTLITITPDSRITIEFICYQLFSPFDIILPGLNSEQRNKFITMFNEIESDIKTSNIENHGWWLSEIYLRKARLSEDIIEKEQEYRLWKTAYSYGYRNNNYEVIAQAGQSLSFNFPEFFSSIKELAEVQLNLAKAICSQKNNLDRLETVGINLLKLWSKLSFSRLSEHDLKAKQALMDGAKILVDAGFSANEASPIMVLLLLSAFDHKGPCVVWAKDKLSMINKKIPEDIKEKIAKFFDKK